MKEQEQWLPTKKDLAKLPKEAMVAYAVRNALRVLPLIRDESLKELEIALMTAVLLSMGAKFSRKDLMLVESYVSANAAYYISAIASFDDVNSAANAANAANAVNAAYDATNAAFAVNAANAANAAHDAAYAASDAAPFLNISRYKNISIAVQEYELFLNMSKSKTAVSDIYKKELWFHSKIESERFLNGWQIYLNKINSAHIFNRYMHFYHGTVDRINWENIEADVRSWIATLSLESESDKSTQKEDFSSENEQKAEPPLTQPPKNEYATSKGGGMSDVDLLGREKVTNSLASMISSDNQDTPFTIGLLGDWGSGKSNLMHLLKKNLKGRPDANRFYFADFNAWEYEHTDNMTAGVAQEVLKGFLESLGFWKRLWTRLQFGFKENGWGVPVLIGVLFVLLIFSIVQMLLQDGNQEVWYVFFGTSLAFLLGFSKRIFTIIEHPLTAKINNYLRLPNYMNHLGTIPLLKRHLRNLCKIIIPEKKENSDRLIVFVDDLDRCEPDAISRTLDAIRLVMDIKNVVVIIGIDHRIAFRAIEMQYSDLADDNRTSADIARDYLGKIIQLPIQLQKPELLSFINEELFKGYEKFSKHDEISKREKNNSGGDEENKTELYQKEVKGDKSPENKPEKEKGKPDDYNNKRDASGSADSEIGDNKVTSIEMTETELEVKQFTELINLFGFDNPRQLIRLRNCYRLLKGLDRGTDEEMRLIMIMLFWLEYVFDLGQEKRDKILDDNNKPDYKKLTGAPNIKKKVETEFKEKGLYDVYLNKVSYVVLPHSESPLKA